MKAKKIIALFLTMCCLGSLAACNSSPVESANLDPDASVVETSDNQGDDHYYKYFKVFEIVKDGVTTKAFDLDKSVGTLQEARENVSGEINIPEGVDTICSFKGFTKITKVTIPEGVTVLPFACFEGCSALTEVKLADSIEVIEGNTFKSCTNMTSVVMPKSLKTLGGTADYYRSGISSIYFPAEVQLENYIKKSDLGVSFTCMPRIMGSRVITVYLVEGSWLDVNFKSLYEDESSEYEWAVDHNEDRSDLPEIAYWNG